MVFKDRLEAARLLAKKLELYKSLDGIVYAVPRGGVPIGYFIAGHLHFALEVILTKKIGHPINSEYAIGSVSLQGRILDETHDVPKSYIESETERIREDLERKYRLFMGKRQPLNPEGKIVIVVDDGIATGNTLMASFDILRKKNPKKLIAAVPVIPFNRVKEISRHVDELVYLTSPKEFHGVGQFYENFEQVSDAEVMGLLK